MMKIIDLHCDTLYAIYNKKAKELKNNGLHISTEKLKSAGSFIQCFALFDSKPESGYSLENFKKYMSFGIKLLNGDESINIIRSISDIDEAKINALITMEDAGSLDGKLENLEMVCDMGVRMIALLWNYENAYGYPNSDDSLIMGKGLKQAGREAVCFMNENNIVVDVSHMSYGCFWDVAHLSKKPFIASHSCCDALCAHRRNLTDEMLKTISGKGGVCGINFYADFIGARGGVTTLENILCQAEYIKNVAGIDAIALGSDFDGIENGLEIKDFAGMPLIADSLKKKGFTSEEIDKVMYKNAYRVLGEVIG